MHQPLAQAACFNPPVVEYPPGTAVQTIAQCTASRVGRTLHLRFNDLTDPEPVPRETGYASVFPFDVAIVLQHTRPDSRRPALSNTVAFCQQDD